MSCAIPALQLAGMPCKRISLVGILDSAKAQTGNRRAANSNFFMICFCVQVNSLTDSKIFTASYGINNGLTSAWLVTRWMGPIDYLVLAVEHVHVDWTL